MSGRNTQLLYSLQTLPDGKHEIRRPDGSRLFVLAADDRGFARKILSNLNAET